jgi:hypothetical protein
MFISFAPKPPLINKFLATRATSSDSDHTFFARCSILLLLLAMLCRFPNPRFWLYIRRWSTRSIARTGEGCASFGINTLKSNYGLVMTVTGQSKRDQFGTKDGSIDDRERKKESSGSWSDSDWSVAHDCQVCFHAKCQQLHTYGVLGIGHPNHLQNCQCSERSIMNIRKNSQLHTHTNHYTELLQPAGAPQQVYYRHQCTRDEAWSTHDERGTQFAVTLVMRPMSLLTLFLWMLRFRPLWTHYRPKRKGLRWKITRRTPCGYSLMRPSFPI